ncbi:MAG TPA: pyruvate formate-lyase-activating protein [Anaerovoracaceae bacterium]|nr:pyruvate formate-lyase-activating protein [Anaerovoracaceae bacterium]
MSGKGNTIMGKINSFQSLGAVDGPGIRFVIFMEGCPLRCVYCHNPETWSTRGAKSDAERDGKTKYRVEEVVEKCRRFSPYFGEEGGVTVSGGEPLLQWEFVSELFRRLKDEGVHTALDTSGIGSAGIIQGSGSSGGDPAPGSFEAVRQILKYTDLVICDLKFSTEEEYRLNCGGSLEEVLAFLELTEEMRVPLWIRHVVVPGLTDREESLSCIVQTAKRFSSLEKIELLPFRKLCMAKYEALGIPFPLAGCEECPDEKIIALCARLLKK